ncbi:MAG: tetratricopeptide repeat protein [Myxococcota bacterium]
MRRRPNRSRGWIVALAALAVLGCASSAKLAYSPESFRSLVRARVPELPESEIIVPYLLDREAVATARKVTRRRTSPHDKALALARSLGNPRWFGLRYEWATSGSAAETLDSGLGNCLSLSSVFVGLARGLGLEAYYVDASRRPQRRREGAVIVSAGHIGVAVPTPGGVTLVDFTGELGRYHRVRRIDDLEALAHLYNNRGYEVIHQAQSRGKPIPWDEARRYFRLATQVSPDFARAWNNLGIAYGHLGDREEAERTYRTAIDRDPRLSSPHLNLANLHLESGKPEAALTGLQTAVRLDGRNPFAHYLRGLAFARSGALRDAEKALKKSLRLKGDLVDARVLLAEVRQRLADDRSVTGAH